MSNSTIILHHQQIEQKINRIAHEIYENHFLADKIYLVGICGQGYVLAERLAAILTTISENKIELLQLTLNKDLPLSEEIKLSIDVNELHGKTVILIDDVLNSGKTLIYAASFLLQVQLQKLNTACLVDRRHRKFPIRADFVGLTLSTTLQEHIEVEFKSGNDSVYLV